MQENLNMRLFLTILEGPSPEEAEPILATEDDRLIEVVASWIEERLRPAFYHHNRGPKLGCGETNAPTQLHFFATHDLRSGPPAERRGA